MSRTKQQRVTVVNSRQNKSRLKCGSCCICQESTYRCQTTQFKVACTRNNGDMCILALATDTELCSSSIEKRQGV